MATSLVSTGVQFPDSTIQTTAASAGVTSLNGQTGAITNTSLYAIGSYVTGRPANATQYNVDATIAGSSLYSVTMFARWNGSIFREDFGGTTVSSNLVNTGTWRCVTSCYTGGAANSLCGLWVRIS